MVALEAERREDVQSGRPGNGLAVESRVLLFFLGLLIVGAIGYLALRGPLIGSIFAHVGGSGVIGLLAGLAGTIAKKKGFSYWKALLLGFILPVVLGVIAVLLVQSMSCGGSVSLVVALLIVIIYSVIRPRDPNFAGDAA
jgi:hypothetical protein